MQCLFPLFNYTSCKNKTSIFHLSLPTEGTLNLILCPLHSPALGSISDWDEGWALWALHRRGQQVPAETTSPEEPALPPGNAGHRGKRCPEGIRAAGTSGKAVPRGRCLQAQGSGLSLAQLGWVRLQTPPEPGGSSCWSHTAAPAPGCWAGVQEVPGLEQLCRGSTDPASLCLATLGLGAQSGPQSVPGPWLGHSAPWALQLSIALSCIWGFGEQNRDRRQICAKGDGSTCSSWSLGVSKLRGRLNRFKIQYAALWKCIVCRYTFIYKDQRKVLLYVV